MPYSNPPAPGTAWPARPDEFMKVHTVPGMENEAARMDFEKFAGDHSPCRWTAHRSETEFYPQEEYFIFSDGTCWSSPSR